MLHVDLMEVIAAKKIQPMVGISTAQIVYALKCQKQLNHPWNKQLNQPLMNVLFHTGLVTTFVMMKTTILNVDLMEVIAAKKIQLKDGTTIVLNVYAWISQRLLKPLENVVFHNGLVITTAMTTTTMLGVVLMAETVVETMSTPPTAPNVHVLNDYILYIPGIVVQIKKRYCAAKKKKKKKKKKFGEKKKKKKKKKK